MAATAIIEELTFTRCKNWDTPECPNIDTPAMGLAAINWPHLYLLNDETVRELGRMCQECNDRISKRQK